MQETVRPRPRGLVTFVTCLAVGGSAFARQAEGPRAPDSGAPVVRVSVEVIQVDAVVTDKDDRHVSDLGPADFEILEDGRRQDITHCSYVPLDRPPVTPPGSMGVMRFPRTTTQEAIRRTMVFVVDDLSLTFRSMVAARQALARFVDEQMQPGDFVAILQTGAGNGAIQQFTSDKRVLRAAIARLRFNLAARGTITSPAIVEGSGGNASAPASRGGGSGAGDAALAVLRGQMNDFADASQRQRQLHLAMGTMGALQSVLHGLQQLPGRKSLVFLSEGFVQNDRFGERSETYQRLRAVTDLANRASVVVYAINPAGLETFSPYSAEQPDPSTGQSSRKASEEARGGLSTLADETGGLLLTDNNDISGAVGHILDDQSGYYLIGYKPDESLFKPDNAGLKYHKIEIKMKRPGLTVRSRKGFYAVARAGSEAMEHEGLASAVYSPFAARDFDVRLTSLFGSDPKTGPYVRSLLYIDLQGVMFQEQPDGSSQAKLEVGVMTFGVDGFAVERFARSVTIPEFFEGARREGIAFTLDVPVKKPGPYQVRAAVRDLASARLGSASQFLEVPNLGADRLALSGLIMSEKAAADGSDARPATDVGDPDSTPAMRRFHRGMSVSYALSVYNARTRSDKGHPDLLVRPSLYRDDHLLQSMPTLSFDGAGQPDAKRLALRGSFSLDATMEPGVYVLEVAVQDKAAGSKSGPAAQWMDFEVVD
jgi:VWFA-related protein